MKDYEILDSIMAKLEDGYYDGSSDLLPWKFNAEYLTPTECLVLVRAWHGIGKVWSFSDCKNEDSVKNGYTYIAEFKRSIYRIEINENMALWSIEKITTLEPQF